MPDNKLISKTIYDTLPEESFNSGKPPKPEQMYIPPAHIKSLQLYSSLVIGARGVGKSTWTAALADTGLRKIIGANIAVLERTNVQIGFSEKDDKTKRPDIDAIRNLLEKNFSPYDMWRAVLARWLAKEISREIPVASWEETTQWVKSNPEAWTDILQKADQSFQKRNKNGLILFDALDRTGENWETMNEIVRDLLRLVMRLKSYSNIHTKIFLREDQLSASVTNFPDYSKLQSTKTELTWSLLDLHGLLWQHLCNAKDEGGKILRDYCYEISKTAIFENGSYWSLGEELKRDEKKQRELFQKIAGPYMGKDIRRGIPYIWSVSHLADGKGQTSPRSFVAAIRTAAEDSENYSSDYPLYYGSIKRGVQNASSIRIGEITEDYDWIRDLCSILGNKENRLIVPVDFESIKDIWKQKYPNGPREIETKKLPPQYAERGWDGIKEELIRLGVFEERLGGRINMPDLYRVGFGLGRKGGVTPVK